MLESPRVLQSLSTFRISQSFLYISLDDISADVVAWLPDKSAQYFAHNYNISKMRLNGLLALSILMIVSSVSAAERGEETDILRFWNTNASNSHSNADIPRTLFVSSWSKQGRKYAIQFAKKF